MTAPSHLNRATAEFTCNDCSVTFRRRVDAITRAKDGLIRCNKCSRTHANSNRPKGARRRGATKSCPICSTEFYTPRSKADQVTCSAECRAKRQLEMDRMPEFMRNASDNSGSRNGRYVNGRSVGRNKGPSHKVKVRADVIERDGDWCLYCGRPGPGLHLHRVVYGSQGGKYEASNCVQLCAQDHARIHSSKSTWMPLLLEYLAHANPAISYQQGWLKRSGIQ